jgi:hypothetical protein
MTTTPQVPGAEEGALKPCPACKGAASHLKRSAGMPGTQGFDSWRAVCCIACGLTLGESDRRFRSKDEAAKGWNHRATFPEPWPTRQDVLDWAVGQWRAQVENRPLVNVHRRTLDDTWRQVIRFAGGDPDELIGPAHDSLLAASSGGST